MKNKKAFYTIALFVIASTAAFAAPVKLVGKVTGVAADKAMEIAVFADGKTQRIALDKDSKTFDGSIELSQDQFVELRSGGSIGNFVYLVPGETVELVIEKLTQNESKLTFKAGKTEKLNAIIAEFYKVLNENEVFASNKDWLRDLINQTNLVKTAFQKSDNLLVENQKLLKSFAPNFNQNYQLMKQSFVRYTEIDEYSLQRIEEILTELSTSDLQTSALTVPSFKEFLVDITNAYAARKMETYGLKLENAKSSVMSQTIAAEVIVRYIPNKAIVNYLFFDKISHELTVNTVKNPTYLKFLFDNASPKMTAPLLARYEKLKANTLGANANERVPAKDFEFVDLAGKKYTLSDFKGKLLLLDFWASWCGPCKAQIPAMKELEKIYAGREIVFASVSLDNQKADWIKGVKENNLHNLVLYAEGAFRNPFPLAYGISSIPRFMLIDADGKIITDNMPKPDKKEEVMALINADLNKAELAMVIQKNLDAIGANLLMSGKDLSVKSLHSAMGIDIDIQVNYHFPKTLRYDFSPRRNENMLKTLGERYFTSKYMIVDNDSVYGTIKDAKTLAKTWGSKLPGFEILIAQHVEKAKLEMDAETSTNPDNQYVIKATFSDKTEKYYIDKKDFLIKKVVYNRPQAPRKGGGTLDAEVTYNEYRTVDGITLPFYSGMNNIIKINAQEAKLKPYDAAIYKPL
jgi:thiol-disulfide isomerase/thioredoxin